MINLKKKQQSSTLIVTQSNQLVEARYNLSLAEQRLILAMIARIQPEDEDFKPYHISIGEFAEFMGISKNSMYQECQKITKKLLGRVVEINEVNGLLQTGWVSSAKYVNGSGMVYFAFDPLLKPYLLQLKGNFTSCKLEMLLSFKSQYTMRLYTMLKQYQNLGVREFEIELLREMLGLGKSQYVLYGNFKMDLLEPIRKELLAKADLYFEFDEIKYGRRVGAVRFHIFNKKLLESNTNAVVDSTSFNLCSTKVSLPSVSDELMLLIPEQHRAKKTVNTALETFEKKHGFDYVKRNILYCNAKADKSYAGFLNNSLKEDWGHDWELDQKMKSVKKKAVEVWEQQGFPNLKQYEDFMYRKQMKEYGIKVESFAKQPDIKQN